MKGSDRKILAIYFTLIVIALAGCSGGGGSSPPSPSLSSNLPSTAFDDETIVVTVTARNFGSDETTYNATSKSLSIDQGNSNNQFVIRGVNSAPGNHTITFSASDTSGKSATLNSTIRIDAVAAGDWYTTSLSIGGIYTYDVTAAVLVTREGRVYLESYTYDLFDEKCFGSSSISVTTFTFELWCASAPDGYQVTDENYRLTGELEINGDYAVGTYSLYGSSGGLEGTVEVEMERDNFYERVGELAPADATGVYAGSSDANGFELISIDSAGTVSPTQPGGACDVSGSVAPINIDFSEDNDYVRSGIFDAASLSQTGCINPYGNFPTGNRDILSGEGVLWFAPGSWYGFSGDEYLFIAMSDSANSYGGIPSGLGYWRVCSASGKSTPYADYFGLSGACSGQSNAAWEKPPAGMNLQKHSKTPSYTSPHALPRPYRQAQ